MNGLWSPLTILGSCTFKWSALSRHQFGLTLTAPHHVPTANRFHPWELNHKKRIRVQWAHRCTPGNLYHAIRSSWIMGFVGDVCIEHGHCGVPWHVVGSIKPLWGQHSSIMAGVRWSHYISLEVWFCQRIRGAKNKCVSLFLTALCLGLKQSVFLVLHPWSQQEWSCGNPQISPYFPYWNLQFRTQFWTHPNPP